MDTKKDIGEFFKNNLNQMDFSPNENGWNKIEDELNQKKKRRRVFFWLFFSSILSLCIITALLITNKNSLVPKDEIFKNQETTISNKNFKKKSETNNFDTVNKRAYAVDKRINPTNSNIQRNAKDSASENKTKNNSLQKNFISNSIHKKNSITNNSIPKDKSNSVTKNKITTVEYYSKSNKNKNKNNINKKGFNLKNNSHKEKYVNHNTNNKFEYTHTKSKSDKKNNFIKTSTANIETNRKDNDVILDTKNHNIKELFNQNYSENSRLIIDTSKLVTNDSTSTALIIKEVKEIKDKNIKTLEKDSIKVPNEAKSNTFIFSPYFGYGLPSKNQIRGHYNTLHKLNISNKHYGFLLRWMTDKKNGIQIGLGYIDASTKVEIEKIDSNNLFFNDVSYSSNISSGSANRFILHHNLSMYEIPIEFYHKLNDKKISFSFASGINYILTKNNNVYLETAEGSTRIGSLESIMKQNFAANIKVYATYKFSDKLQFELYPSLQYQFMNSLKNEKLNSFIISVRTGLSYQF